MLISKKKERENFKRQKIYELYVYGNKEATAISKTLNQDAEFVRKCGKIPPISVRYWINKIKKELEHAVDSDGMERFVAEFTRKAMFFDKEISDITDLLEKQDLKLDERHKFMSLRHQIAKDSITILSDHELPLTVKKYKKDRELMNRNLKTIDEDLTPKIEFKQLDPRLKNRVAEEE